MNKRAFLFSSRHHKVKVLFILLYLFVWLLIITWLAGKTIACIMTCSTQLTGLFGFHCYKSRYFRYCRFLKLHYITYFYTVTSQNCFLDWYTEWWNLESCYWSSFPAKSYWLVSVIRHWQFYWQNFVVLQSLFTCYYVALSIGGHSTGCTLSVSLSVSCLSNVHVYKSKQKQIVLCMLDEWCMTVYCPKIY